MSTEKDSKKIKRSSRGGARPGAGRPAGSTNKITGEQLIQAISSRCGQDYAQQLAANYVRCLQENDKAMVAKYDQMLLNKVIADKTELDVTTAGQQLVPTLVFQPARLPDWDNEPRD